MTEGILRRRSFASRWQAFLEAAVAKQLSDRPFWEMSLSRIKSSLERPMQEHSFTGTEATQERTSRAKMGIGNSRNFSSAKSHVARSPTRDPTQIGAATE